MKTAIRWFTPFVLFAMFLATSSICSANQIVGPDLNWAVLQSESVSSLNLSVYMLDSSGNPSQNILLTSVSPADDGTTFVSTILTPGFASFINILTNGADNNMVVSMKSPSGNSQFGTLTSESLWFGHSIDSSYWAGFNAVTNIGLKINDLQLIPFGPGTYVENNVSVSINTIPDSSPVVYLPSGSGGSGGGGSGGSGSMIAPEPNTLFLLATGLAVLAFPLWKKRKQILH